MSGGSFRFEDVKNLQKQLEQMQKDQEKLCEECAKYLAQRFLAKVKQRTPVDSGELRRNWTVGEIKKNGGNYEVEIMNPTSYASYVEYGHRTGNHRGWVPGRLMMTISEQELQAEAPAILERKFLELLRRAFDA